MITLLLHIVEAVTFIPDYILYAIETLWNLFIAAIDAVFVLATKLIPLPEEPSPPEFISNINWFLWLGPVITVATPIVAGYVIFLAVRWIFAKVGDL